MERLNHIIKEALIEGKWEPIQASINGPRLSNLCFADDIILLAEATIEQGGVLKHCPHKFCVASGFQDKFRKVAS